MTSRCTSVFGWEGVFWNVRLEPFQASASRRISQNVAESASVGMWGRNPNEGL